MLEIWDPIKKVMSFRSLMLLKSNRIDFCFNKYSYILKHYE